MGIEPLFELSIFTAVDKVKDHILYNKVWKDNWTYESIVITSYFKLDPSLPIFDYMNGSLFDKLVLIVDLHIYYLKQP